MSLAHNMNDVKYTSENGIGIKAIGINRRGRPRKTLTTVLDEILEKRSKICRIPKERL